MNETSFYIMTDIMHKSNARGMTVAVNTGVHTGLVNYSISSLCSRTLFSSEPQKPQAWLAFLAAVTAF